MTTYSAIEALRDGTAKQYHTEYLEREKLLRDDSLTEVYLKEFSVKPYLLFFVDVMEDTSNWINYTVADYYGKEKVGLIER